MIHGSETYYLSQHGFSLFQYESIKFCFICERSKIKIDLYVVCVRNRAL